MKIAANASLELDAVPTLESLDADQKNPIGIQGSQLQKLGLVLLPGAIELPGKLSHFVTASGHPRSRLLRGLVELNVIGQQVARANPVKTDLVELFDGAANGLDVFLRHRNAVSRSGLTRLGGGPEMNVRVVLEGLGQRSLGLTQGLLAGGRDV